MVAIMFLVLIGFVAIATDTGLIWMNRRSLQNAADAAALAGVQELPNLPVNARDKACTFAGTKNAIPEMIFDCAGPDIQIYQTYYPNDTITVTVHKVVNPVFGLALGFTSTEIDATATAVVGSIASNCPFPVFQTPERLPGGSAENMQFYTETSMKLSSNSDQNEGNNSTYLLVDVGSGANAIRDAMMNNSCGEEIGPDASTKTGNNLGPVLTGFEWRLACATGANTPNNSPSCPGPSACPSPDITNYLTQVNGLYELDPSITRANCTRLVIVPIFPGPFPGPIYETGTATVTIQGFAIFYIKDVCTANGPSGCTHPTLGALKKGDAWGYYVRMATPADEYTGYNGFGSKVFALID